MKTLWLLVVIFLAMGSQDILQALYQRFMAARRFVLAGHSDGLMDVLSFIFVVGAVTNHARTWQWFLSAGLTLYFSSVLGTVIGCRFEEWITARWPGPPTRKELPVPIHVTERRAGRRGVSRASHAPELALANFRTVEPTPPPSGDVTLGLTEWGMLANGPTPGNTPHTPTGVGDCGVAAFQHARMAKALASVADGVPTYEPGFTPATAQETEALYFAYGRAMGEPGLRPDQGVANATWLKYLFDRTDVDEVEWFAQLDPSNPAEFHQAMLDGKGILVGVALTSTAEQDFEDHQPWHLDGGQPDHDVYFVAYDADGFTVITWGGVQRCTGQVSEAWVFGTKEDAQRAGYNADALIAACRSWGATVTGS